MRPPFSQQGQALFEFLTGAGVLLVFLMVIPLVGNLLQIRLHTVKAADYVHWATVKGISDTEAGLKEDVRQRFYARSQPRSDAAWTNEKGKPLVDMNSIAVTVEGRADASFQPARQMVDALDLSRSNAFVAKVRVSVFNLPDYPYLAPVLTMQEQVAGLSGDWSGGSPADVEQRIEHASKMHPYPKSQRRVITHLSRFLKLIFNEPKAEQNMVRPEYVPADRLEPYVD